MDASRSFATAGKLQVENTFPAETLAALEARGHVLEPMGRPLGGSQAVWIDHANGCLIAGSDPRKDGCALGYRSEEHTSELQSLMRISYAVFCLKKKQHTIHQH